MNNYSNYSKKMLRNGILSIVSITVVVFMAVLTFYFPSLTWAFILATGLGFLGINTFILQTCLKNKDISESNKEFSGFEKISELKFKGEKDIKPFILIETLLFILTLILASVTVKFFMTGIILFATKEISKMEFMGYYALWALVSCIFTISASFLFVKGFRFLNGLMLFLTLRGYKTYLLYNEKTKRNITIFKKGSWINMDKKTLIRISKEDKEEFFFAK